MFGRRVFGSTPIPKAMFARLHINTAAQATRLLPALIPLSPSLCRSSLTDLSHWAPCGSAGGTSLDITPQDPILLKALIESMSPLQLGYLRLLELWGIARIGVVTKMLPSTQSTGP